MISFPSPTARRPLPAEMTIPVGLEKRSYDIRVTSGRLADVGRFASEVLDRLGVAARRRRAFIVTDEHVRDTHARSVADSLAAAGFERDAAVVPAGEATKSLARATELYDRLLDIAADRQ